MLAGSTASFEAVELATLPPDSSTNCSSAILVASASAMPDEVAAEALADPLAGIEMLATSPTTVTSTNLLAAAETPTSAVMATPRSPNLTALSMAPGTPAEAVTAEVVMATTGAQPARGGSAASE